MIPSPTQVEMNPANPAPAIPMRGAPRRPKMKIKHSITLSAFMITALTMWT